MFRVLVVAVCTIVVSLVNAISTIFPWALLAGFIYWLFF